MQQIASRSREFIKELCTVDSVTMGGAPPIEAWHVVVNSRQSGETIRFSLARTPPYVVGLKQEWEGLDWTFERVD
jgi:hypothetical protein